MVNAEQACDPTQIHTIHIELHRLFAHGKIIAALFLLRRVFAVTHKTAVTLAPCGSCANLVLFGCGGTLWTFHKPILPSSSATPQSKFKSISPSHRRWWFFPVCPIHNRGYL